MTEDQLKAIEDRFARGGFSNWDFEKLIDAAREARRLLRHLRSRLESLHYTPPEIVPDHIESMRAAIKIVLERK